MNDDSTASNTVSRVTFHSEASDLHPMNTVIKTLRHGSHESLAEELGELTEEDGEQGRLLRFKNPQLEALYFGTLQRERSHFFVFLSLFWAGFAAFEFFMVNGIYRLAQDDPAGLLSGASRLSKVVFLCICSFIVKRRLVNFESVTVFAILLVTTLLVTDNTYRMTRMLGTTYYYDEYGDCGHDGCFDDSFFVLILVLGTASMPMVMSVRFCRGWVLAPYSVLTYSLSSLAWGPQPPVDHILITIFIAALCLMVFYGSYRMELESRLRWFHAQMLRSRVVAQQRRLDEQNDWLRRVEAKLEAMAFGTDRVGARATPFAGGGGAKEDRTVPLPPELALEEVKVQAPNALLAGLLQGRKADAARLRRMAERLVDPGYGMREFFEDSLQTFPELGLFRGAPPKRGPAPQFSSSTSASSIEAGARGDEVEYQRTMGAMFAVYWLLRLEGDGKEGFCYGVGRDWKIRESTEGMDPALAAKRLKFMANMNWSVVSKMVKSAIHQSVERREAMLVLTALHDIMKMPCFCPKVSEEHAPYHGYAAGDAINDHDAALAYVLRFYPELLPSYRILPEASRDLILFTQGDMHFNHGWFVQAEAPPGLMLKTLKQVLANAQAGDLAFYFFHWVTDLSGADGGPLAGAEKFVCSFPMSVLSAFLWSIPYLQHLQTKTETEVVESYLEARVKRDLPDWELPTGSDAVATMRLMVMAQSGCRLVLEALEMLPDASRKVLIKEMSHTGAEGQRFKNTAFFGEQEGPGLFIYYGPALLQRCQTVDEMAVGLSTLAAIYHAGRMLWPLRKGYSSTVVTLEAGSLRSRDMAAIADGASSCNGDIWVLETVGSFEAKVKLLPPAAVNALLYGCGDSRVAFLDVDAKDDNFCMVQLDQWFSSSTVRCAMV